MSRENERKDEKCEHRWITFGLGLKCLRCGMTATSDPNGTTLTPAPAPREPGESGRETVSPNVARILTERLATLDREAAEIRATLSASSAPEETGGAREALVWVPMDASGNIYTDHPQTRDACQLTCRTLNDANPAFAPFVAVPAPPYTYALAASPPRPEVTEAWLVTAESGMGGSTIRNLFDAVPMGALHAEERAKGLRATGCTDVRLRALSSASDRGAR